MRGDPAGAAGRFVDPADRLSPQAYLRGRESTEANRAREQAGHIPAQPTASLLVPVEDASADALCRSVESLSLQRHQAWEALICGGNARAENTARAALRRVAPDPRVRIASPAGQGIADALNRALNEARGEFVGVLRPGDALAPDALSRIIAAVAPASPDILYSDEDCVDETGTLGGPIFKPDWSPELALSYPYVGGLCLLRRRMVHELGGWREECAAAEEYDLILRAAASGAAIAHVPDVLYHRHRDDQEDADRLGGPSALEARTRALERYIRTAPLPADIIRIPTPPGLRVRCRIEGNPLVSVIIPTRDLLESLRRCIGSIQSRTRYAPYEIVIVDNDSIEPATREYLVGCGHRVVPHPGPFNFGALNNAGARVARGTYLLFLNNDTEVIEPEWLSAMLEWAQQPSIACVGAKLILGDGRLQHVGVAMRSGAPHHLFYRQQPGQGNRWSDTDLVRDCVAVTAACLMIRRNAFEAVGGFDESFPVNYNDVDLCLRLAERGFRTVYTPYAVLYHHESSSRPAGVSAGEERHLRDVHGERLWTDSYWPDVEYPLETTV
jgi:GT2 family glycosyltransferase